MSYTARTLLTALILFCLSPAVWAANGQPFEELQDQITAIQAQLEALAGGAVQDQIDQLTAAVGIQAATIAELQATITDLQAQIDALSPAGSFPLLKTLYSQRTLAAGAYLVASEVCPEDYIAVSGGIVPVNGVYTAGGALAHYGANPLDPAVTFDRTWTNYIRSTLTFGTTVYSTVLCIKVQ